MDFEIRNALPLNVFDVFIYGATYGYPDIYQKAAPIVVLQNPLSEVLSRLPANLLAPWVTNASFFVMRDFGSDLL